jgi:carbon storage regulator
MLVLNRRRGESIRIAEDVLVTVVDMSNGNVKIGIEAPRDVPVVREEIKDLPVKPRNISTVRA